MDQQQQDPLTRDATLTRIGTTTGPLPAFVGPFRILARIGDGAMGVVYEAEQERPHRRVALKVMQPGLATAALLRRFEHEYEFLGRLDHPGIAQIYQAGIAGSGPAAQPYFAMELVRGERLDVYVRSHAPGLADRLSLVAAVADAVQHAHHRGIIHRDLKPANVVVTPSGQPKVLDFGLARATQEDLFSTIRTMAGEVLGTISYMSPEQLSGDHSEVDTRSDVYAIGVMLYEVIAGRLPYEISLRPLPEAMRIIRDEEPARLNSATGRLPGDVETIVAKALEKDKSRRYSSATELAEDIRRFLRHEPIVARRPSAAYQIRKFARRHTALVAGVVACLLALIAGVVATSWQAIRASRAERVAQARADEAQAATARAEAVTAFLTDTLSSVDPAQARGREVTVRAALDAAAARIDAGAMAGQPQVEAAVRSAIGTTYEGLGLFGPAERQLRAAIQLQSGGRATASQRADTQTRLVNVLYHAGRHRDAIPVAREALRLRREAVGARHATVATALDDLGALLWLTGRLAEAEPLMQESLRMRRALLPPDHPQLAVGLNNLAHVLREKGDYHAAESMFREAVAIDRRVLGDEHPEVPKKLVNIALVLRDQGRPEAAEPVAREAVATRRRILGSDHPALANALDVLAGSLSDRGLRDEAEPLLREALSIARRAYGARHADTARLQNNLGALLTDRGAYAEAEPLLRAGAATLEVTSGPMDAVRGVCLANLARSLNGLGDFRGAETSAAAAVGVFRDRPGDGGMVGALIALGDALLAQRRGGEAVASFREAVDLTREHPPARIPWYRFEAESGLGASLAAIEPSLEAEGLLVSGYTGLRDLPAAPRPRLRVAVERLVWFYDRSGRRAEAAVWKHRLAAIPPPPYGGHLTPLR